MDLDVFTKRELALKVKVQDNLLTSTLDKLVLEGLLDVHDFPRRKEYRRLPTPLWKSWKRFIRSLTPKDDEAV